MRTKTKSFWGCRTLVGLIGALAIASASQAQPRDHDDPPWADDIRQAVARVAYFSGEVSYSRGDEPDDWQPASLNFPMTLGDRLYTGKGSRVELQTEGGTIYLAPQTDLAALNLTDDAKQFSLGTGTASFSIRRVDSGEFFEVDTPNAAITFDRPGRYRIDVDHDGNTRVIANRGHAYVAAGGGEVPLGAGDSMTIDGIDSPVFDVTSLPPRDSWDRWVQKRLRRVNPTGSRRYVNPNISGLDDLDEYGSWSNVPEYGMVWSPTNVPAGWQPYRSGRWVWQDPWGWNWVSNEPWGWAPYHYGRWVTFRSRWCWVPAGPQVRTVRYAPALVAFVGGPGFSVSVSAGESERRAGGGDGFVGWFPLAPRDPFVPWWGSAGRATNVTNVTNVTKVTYVNRTYVTVVNHNTFISGAPVGRNLIGDARTVREISAAPVVRGPIQVVPVASSIRVSTENARSAPSPPAAVLKRAVATRRAPPPAPPLFREKAKLIRENRGAPVAPAEAAGLAPESRATRPTRSVVVEGGRVKLAPKKARATGPAPVPVTGELRPGQSTTSTPAQEKRSPANAQPQDNETRRRQDAEAKKQEKQADDARKQQDAEAKKQEKQADDARKQQDAEAQKQQKRTDEARRQQQDAADQKERKQADDTRKQQAVEDQKQRKQADDTRKQQAVEAQKQRKEADDTREQDAAAQKQRKQADDNRKQQAVEDQKQRKQADDARKQQAVEAQKQRKEADDTREQDAAAQKQRKQADDTGKQQAVEAQRQRKQADDARKQQAVEAQRQRKQADDAPKQQAVEDQKEERQTEGTSRQKNRQKNVKDKEATGDKKKGKKPPTEDTKPAQDTNTPPEDQD